VADHAVAVCGFGRCGSTMLMSMLVAGGCPPGNARQIPYEGDPAALEGRDLTGTCVKLLHGSRMGEVPAGTPRWRFVWMDRDVDQQAKSMIKFLGMMAPVTGVTPRPNSERRIARAFAEDRPYLLGALRRVGPVLVLDYERVLTAPRKTAKLLRRDVWPGLDVDAAAAVVHRRDGRCVPDLAFELSTLGADVSTGGQP
jgi:hypothetical protein